MKKYADTLKKKAPEKPRTDVDAPAVLFMLHRMSAYRDVLTCVLGRTDDEVTSRV